MSYKELEEYYLPLYEMETISHPEYSHCITIDYGDTIFAYKDREDGKWYLTDYLVIHRPESMEVSFLMGEETREVSLEEMLRYFTKEELFLECL